jgi:hypothetical protein
MNSLIINGRGHIVRNIVGTVPHYGRDFRPKQQVNSRRLIEENLVVGLLGSVDMRGKRTNGTSRTVCGFRQSDRDFFNAMLNLY